MAKDRWRNFDLELGKSILTLGNVPAPILNKEHSILLPYTVISFPVKPSSVWCDYGKINVVKHMQKRFQEPYYVWVWDEETGEWVGKNEVKNR